MELIDKLRGFEDSRSKKGILSRGANVYNGGTPQATSGPLKPKAPKLNPEEAKREAIMRRLQQGQERNSR